jgi:endogenous inhibitor of DNA gyrase (YacG/DUF329 family)
MAKIGMVPRNIGRVSVACPQCRKKVSWQDNPHRPFCSERCRLIDLGCWVEEAYRMPGEAAGSGQENGFFEGDETMKKQMDERG